MTEEIVIILEELYPLIYKNIDQGDDLTNQELMQYITLIGRLKVIDPELAKRYNLINFNAIGLPSVLNECPICFEEIDRAGIVCKNKNCIHYYHCSCINSWKQSSYINADGNPVLHNTCPFCRAPLDLITIKNERFHFGKIKVKKIKLKNLIKDIFYLKKIKS